MIARIRSWVDALVWGDTLAQYGIVGRFLTGVLRNLYAVMRDIFSGQLTLRAMSLVYTTLLSIVPLIAVSFSGLKAFGVDKYVEPYLYDFVEPLGPAGANFADQVMSLVGNVNSNVLGGIGALFFIYTAISMVQKIEESFNYVWYVTKPRSFATRLIEYSTVLIVGAIAVGLGIKALAELAKEQLVVSIQEVEVFAPVFTITDRLMPYAITVAIFTFLYRYMPNTTVRIKSALVGGLAGGFLWTSTAIIFGSVIATSTNRQAIYAGFAVAISGLIWLYLNWLILLIGSQIAFYYQNPAYLRIGRRDPRLSNEMRERIALNVMFLVGREHRDPDDGINLQGIGRAVRIPTITLEPIVENLEANGLITTDENENILPGREMSRITLDDILATVRRDGETGSHRQPRWHSVIKELGKSLDEAVAAKLGDRTLADLLDEADA
ncbi:MAG: YihY/virulence factor BrkB family protein [Pseudomonadota bacterium]